MFNGMQRIGGTNEEMLRDLAKRTGGIPDFARDALKKAGMDAEVVDSADADARAGRSGRP